MSAAPRTPPAAAPICKPSPISRQEAWNAAEAERERAEISARNAIERAAEDDGDREWLAVAATHARKAEVFAKICALIERCGDGVIAARLNVLAVQEAEAAAALDAPDDGEAPEQGERSEAVASSAENEDLHGRD